MRRVLQARRTAEPSIEPVTLAEAKEHLRVVTSDEDGYISGLITAARVLCENEIDRSFVTSTWRVKLDGFPCEPLELPRPRLVSVTTVQYVDTAQATQTLDSSLYTVDTDSEPGRLLPAYTQIWPSTLGHVNDVIITYTAGYGATAASVPQTIKQAILLFVGHLFENREITTDGGATEVPLAVLSLLAAERWSLK